MLIVGSVLFSAIIFLAIVLITILFGAAGRKSSEEVLKRTEQERRAGVGGDVTQTPDPMHDRYLRT